MKKMINHRHLDPIKKPTYIYGLFDPRRPEIICYVGKSDAPTKRLYMHYRNSSDRMKVWLQELSSVGLQAEVQILEETNINDWQGREKYWIKVWRKRNPALLNVLAGGNGNKQAIPVQEPTSTLTPCLIRIGDAAHYLSCSYHFMEGLIREQIIPSVMLGKRRVVSVKHLNEYAASVIADCCKSRRFS